MRKREEKMELAKIISRTLVISFLVISMTGVLIAQDDNPLINAYNLIENGQYKEAIVIIEPIVEQDTTYTSMVALAGRVYFKLGDLDNAKRYMGLALKQDPGNPDYRESYNEMASFISKLTEANRLNTNADYEGARDIYKEVIQESPNFADAYFFIGRVYVRLNQIDEAAANFRKAIELDPDKEQYQQSFESLTQRFISEGNQLYRRRDYKGAEEKFQQAISLDPDAFMAYYLLGVVKFTEKDFEGALTAVNKSIEINAEYPKAYLVKGKVYHSRKNFNEALAAYNRAAEINPEYSDAWLNVGNINHSLKNFNEAIEAYKKVIAIKPEYAKSYANLGAVYVEQNNLKDAIFYLKKSVELDPRSRNSWLRLAQSYNKTGKCADAKSAAQSALKIKVNWAPALIELGVAERCLGNRAAAKQAFQIASKDLKWKKVAQYELKRME